MKIDHIGIATRGIEESLAFWRDALGLEVRHTETVEEQGVRVAMLPVGEPRVELLEPTGPDTPVARFLEKRGPGLHHVAVRVPDIRAALARLKSERAAASSPSSTRPRRAACCSNSSRARTNPRDRRQKKGSRFALQKDRSHD